MVRSKLAKKTATQRINTTTEKSEKVVVPTLSGVVLCIGMTRLSFSEGRAPSCAMWASFDTAEQLREHYSNFFLARQSYLEVGNFRGKRQSRPLRAE